VWSGGFGLERDAYVFLSNETPYRVRVYCQNGGVRDFGNLVMGSDTVKDIDVTNVDMSGYTTKYGGNLTISFNQDYASGVMSLNYIRSTGLVDEVNFTVFDITEIPMSMRNSTVVSDTPEGSLNYYVENRNHTYWLTARIINDGQLIEKSRSLVLRNDTEGAQVLDFELPATILGVDSRIVYRVIAWVGGVLITLSMAPIDAGYAAVAVVGWFLLMDLVQFIQIPGWLKVVIGILALAQLWGLQRRHDQ